MRYFKNTNKQIFAVDEGQDFLIQSDWQEISEQEVQEINKPSQEKLDQMRVNELKQMLLESDYKVLPDYDKPNQEIIEQRKLWREEIRQLTGQ